MAAKLQAALDAEGEARRREAKVFASTPVLVGVGCSSCCCSLLLLLLLLCWKW
jgi:hypothetical protein